MKFLKLAVIPLLVLSACETTIQNTERVNPSPVAVSPTPDSKLEEVKSSPLPSSTPVPSPTVKIEDMTFKVEIKFDGIVGFTSIDGGQLQRTPLTIDLKGGEHSILVLDVISEACKSNKSYIIDKDTVLDFKRSEICSTG